MAAVLPTGLAPDPEQLLGTVLEVSLTGTLLLRPVLDATGAVADFSYAYLNPAALRLLRLSAPPAGTLLAQCPPASAASVAAHCQAAWLGGASQAGSVLCHDEARNTTYRLAARRSGELLVVSLVAAPEATPVPEAAPAQPDGPAREPATQAQLLSQLLREVPAAVATLRGPEHRYTFFNEQYQAKVNQRAALGRSLAEAQPEVVAQGFVALLDEVYQTGQPYVGTGVPAMLRQPGGQLAQCYYDLTFQRLPAEADQLPGILVFALDVTEQVRTREQVAQAAREVVAAHAEAERQRRQWVQLFERATSAICLLRGPEWRYEFINPAYQALFPGRALLGRPLLEVRPELQGTTVEADFRRVCATGQTFHRTGEFVQLAAAVGGPLQDYYFDLTYQAIYNEQNQVDGFVTYSTNVTEQVLARQYVQTLNEELTATNEELMATNEELNQSNQQLTRANADLDTFVYTASHDLKSPITNVEGLLSVLREVLPPEVQQQTEAGYLLELLDNTVARFRQTITQLTDLIRLQQSYQGPAEMVGLGPLVAEVCQDLALAAEAAQAQLHLDVAPGLWVHFAPANLRSIVYNLMSNAIKYRDAARPAQVWVRAQRHPNHVALAVQDNGLGLTETQQRRLFQVFQRLHTHVEGTGVGLYMIKRLIENAGGTITVESTPEVGSTFTVLLPS